MTRHQLAERCASAPWWRWVDGILFTGEGVRGRVVGACYIENTGNVSDGFHSVDVKHCVPVLWDEVTSLWIAHLISEAYPKYYACHKKDGIAIYLGSEVVARGKTLFGAWIQIAMEGTCLKDENM